MREGAASVAAVELGAGDVMLSDYHEALALIERLHRLLLDVIKDEFERIGRFEVNAVQALLLFNIGSKVMTAGELKSRGHYQGSNVSYNLKKLVEGGFIDHQRCSTDRRAVIVRLTPKGLAVHRIVEELFRRHAADLGRADIQHYGGFTELNQSLRSIERYWGEEIRYIY